MQTQNFWTPPGLKLACVLPCGIAYGSQLVFGRGPTLCDERGMVTTIPRGKDIFYRLGDGTVMLPGRRR